eukprot:10239008-Ditylum_brightwellii.AAC.1
MDNYFTHPKVVGKLHNLGIGVVGTIRFQMSWPPKELRGASQTNVDFNEFYLTVDNLGTLVACWMDNNVILMVSTVHRVGEAVMCMRRRPRIMVKNKGHVTQIWDKQGKVEVQMPRMVDNYNHWMWG